MQYMPVGLVCIGVTYADAWYMDMLYISCFLIFPPQIRKLPKSDLNGVIVWQDEGDTAGGCSKQKAGANGRSALSCEFNGSMQRYP